VCTHINITYKIKKFVRDGPAYTCKEIAQELSSSVLISTCIPDTCKEITYILISSFIQ